MHIVDYETVSRALKQTEHYTLTGEASSLGLPDGQWPPFIQITDLGNGLPFFRLDYIIEDEDELIAVDYRQQCGILTLRIMND